MHTVIIADDHDIVREGVREILSEIDDVSIIAEADNGLTAISVVKKHKPSLLVLDAAMPMARGIEVYSDVRRWSPDTKVVLFTGVTSIGFLSEWFAAGVDGLLLKTCRSEEIKSCFITVLSGSSYIAKSVKCELEAVTSDTVMTAREREVLSLLASGNTNESIAGRLNISPKTVEKHRSSLMKKMGVHSVTELMAFALREGLLDELKQL